MALSNTSLQHKQELELRFNPRRDASDEISLIGSNRSGERRAEADDAYLGDDGGEVGCDLAVGKGVLRRPLVEPDGQKRLKLRRRCRCSRPLASFAGGRHLGWIAAQLRRAGEVSERGMRELTAETRSRTVERRFRSGEELWAPLM